MSCFLPVSVGNLKIAQVTDVNICQHRILLQHIIRQHTIQCFSNVFILSWWAYGLECNSHSFYSTPPLSLFFETDSLDHVATTKAKSMLMALSAVQWCFELNANIGMLICSEGSWKKTTMFVTLVEMFYQVSTSYKIQLSRMELSLIFAGISS